MKRLCAILGVLVLALMSVGTAAAEDGGGAGQAAGQSAASGQTAGGSSGASQYGPTNGAMSIRVLSPGNDGAVSQSNTTTAGAIAANGNKTSQSTDQSQTGGGYGSPYTQIAGQEAKNAQSADADAKAVQVAPSNDALSIRVLSPGNDGDVTQSNAATAGAVAANGNETKQSIDQTQAGSGLRLGRHADRRPGRVLEAVRRRRRGRGAGEARERRHLDPRAEPRQRWRRHAVERRCRDRAALNDNETKQSIDQSQGGSGRSGSGDATQIAGQSAASNGQSADADAKAVQVKPSNSATVDPRAEPGQRRRRHAVEHREGRRPRGERQRDEAVDRPDAGRLGRQTRRRSRGRLRRTTRTPTRMRRPFSGSRATPPRRSASSARARAATSRSRTTLSRSARR